MTNSTTNPALFITDYASYNAGLQFVCGKWYDLTEFNSIDDLLEEIQTVYNEFLNDPENELERKIYIENCIDYIDISNLELMITDFEGFPREMYSESFDTGLIEQLIEFSQLDEDDKNKIEAFSEAFGTDLKTAIEKYEEAFIGEFDSDEDFAYEIAEQSGYEVNNNWPYNCIDWERAARDLMYDYTEFNGYYFTSKW